MVAPDDSRGSGRGRSLPAEVVLDPDDVVQLRCGDLDQLDVVDRLEPVATADRDAGEVSGSELPDRHRAGLVLQVESEPAADHVDRFVLALVVLKREAPAGVDRDELADVAIRHDPVELVAPRLVDPARLPGVGHEPRTSRSPAASIASRSSADVASV